jgi:hypothetical protein
VAATAAFFRKTRARRERALRLALLACVISLAFILLDATGGGLDLRRLALGIELLARILMVILAVIAIGKSRGGLNASLVAGALVCASLDTYWQTTYRYFGSNRLEWIEMLVKYAATGLGLALLLRVCARFGAASGRRSLRWLERWSLPIGAALSSVGVVHGISYIRSCYFYVPDQNQCIIGEPAMHWLNAYLIVDALVRLLIVAAAVIAYFRSSPSQREHTFLVALAGSVFGVGAAVEFLGRLRSSYDAALVLQTFDAITTITFPLLLLVAIRRRELFDVRYPFKIAVSYTLATALVLASWYVTSIIVEITLHQGVHTALLPIEHRLPADFFEYAVGLPFLIAWKPVEKWLEASVENLIMADRKERRERLYEFMRKIPHIDDLAELEHHLQTALSKAVYGKFAEIFVPAGKSKIGIRLSSRDPQPEVQPPILHRTRAPFLSRTEDPVTKVCRGERCSNYKNPKIPGGKLAIPMLGGGKPFGMLVCGAPHETRDFAPDEKDELTDFAAAAGSALFALGCGVKRTPRRKPTVPSKFVVRDDSVSSAKQMTRAPKRAAPPKKQSVAARKKQPAQTASLIVPAQPPNTSAKETP